MTLEREEIFKDYVISLAAAKTAIGAGAGETILEVALGDSIVVTTNEVVSGTNRRRYYRISPIDARTALGFVNGENFYAVTLSSTVNITSRRQTV